MFQVQIILWLQALANPVLDALMQATSELGYLWVYAVLVLLLGFAVRLRPALGVLLVLLVADITSDGLKALTALPRPGDVDARVLVDLAPHVPLLDGTQALQPLGLPAQAVLDAKRADGRNDYGFISGHVAAASAFGFGLLAFFRPRRRWVIAVLAGWPLLMCLSRLYLGRHFPADVLGGLATGAVASVLCAWALVPRTSNSVFERPEWTRWGAAVVLAVVIASMLPYADAVAVGRLVGLGVVLAVGTAWRLPEDGASLAHRLARFGGAVVIAVAASQLVRAIPKALDLSHDYPVQFLGSALVLVATLLGGVALARALGWYRPEDTAR